MDPLPSDLPDFIRDHVRVDDRGCWIWVGSRYENGYGKWASRPAHIRVYEELVGPIEDGLVLDHLCTAECRTLEEAETHRPCVNPDHLEPVTQK